MKRVITRKQKRLASVEFTCLGQQTCLERLENLMQISAAVTPVKGCVDSLHSTEFRLGCFVRWRSNLLLYVLSILNQRLVECDDVCDSGNSKRDPAVVNH